MVFDNFFSCQQGLVLLEDLTLSHAEGNRDYIYYLALGNARLKNYSIALKYLDAFLEVEPNNAQVISLKVGGVDGCYLKIVDSHQ